MSKTGLKLVKISQEVDLNTLVEDYLVFKKAQGVTKYTITNHKSALKYFFQDFEGKISNTKYLKQGVYMFLSDKKNEYYNKILQTLRQFFDYCILENVIKQNPCDGLKYKSHTTRIIQHDEEAIRVLLKVPDRNTFPGLRDYTLMLVMLDTGIRPNELLQIRLEDLDLANSQIIVREEYSKTRQLRILPLSDTVLQSIKKLINVRHSEWRNDVPIFCSFSGHMLTSHNLQEKFRDYSKKAGIKITPYHLRHTFALWFIRNNGNIFALQKMMGHAKLDMTRHYVNLVQADIRNSHKESSPINTLFKVSSRKTKV
jgi:site-specific recombinase XerD